MYIPAYFNQMGYIVCIQIILISTLLFTSGLSKLIKCYRKFRVDYPILAGTATCECFQHFISFLLFVGPLLYGIVYMNYAIRSVTTSIRCFIHYDSGSVTKFLSVFVLILVISPLLCIRDWRKCSFLFVITSILLIVTLFSFSIPVAMHNNSSVFVAYNEVTLKGLMDFIGTYAFSFEGFGMVLAFYRRTAIKGLYNKLFYFAMGTVCFLQIFFSFILSTVDGERGPPKPILDPIVLTKILKFPASYSCCLCLLYLFCIIPGYYLAILPALHKLEQIVKHFFPITGNKRIVKSIAHIFFGITTVLLGLLIGSNADTVAIIVGYSICIPLIMIVPAVIHFILISKTRIERLLDFGLLATGCGTIILAIASLAII